MNRRGFLAALAGAFVVDPERALWVPGKKLISIPKPSNVQSVSVYFYTVNGDSWCLRAGCYGRTLYGDFILDLDWIAP